MSDPPLDNVNIQVLRQHRELNAEEAVGSTNRGGCREHQLLTNVFLVLTRRETKWRPRKECLECVPRSSVPPVQTGFQSLMPYSLFLELVDFVRNEEVRALVIV